MCEKSELLGEDEEEREGERECVVEGKGSTKMPDGGGGGGRGNASGGGGNANGGGRVAAVRAANNVPSPTSTYVFLQVFCFFPFSFLTLSMLFIASFSLRGDEGTVTVAFNVPVQDIAPVKTTTSAFGQGINGVAAAWHSYVNPEKKDSLQRSRRGAQGEQETSVTVRENTTGKKKKKMMMMTRPWRNWVWFEWSDDHRRRGARDIMQSTERKREVTRV